MADRPYTQEQQAAIDAVGKTIVSASAGSGKTTVMIKKIIDLIQGGCPVDSILAVTFTKKAAAQMKEKLCQSLIKEINRDEVSEEKRKQLKEQLLMVPSADISTIHSFCTNIIRSHFFLAEVDNAFRVIGSEDAEGTALKSEALDDLLEEGYEEQDPQFMHLLSVYWRKKSDNALRKIFTLVYEKLRNRADYREYLQNSVGYTEETFDQVCEDLLEILREKCQYYQGLAEEELEFFEGNGSKGPLAVCNELVTCLTEIISAPDYFTACACVKPKFTVLRKGKNDNAECVKHHNRLKFIRDKVVEIYEKELSATATREVELARFLTSGETAAALACYLLKFDDKYAALKREKSVLDFNDLEHKALELLKNDEVCAAIRKKYRYVFVDEYQDVNPVQEEIITRLSGDNLFLVGDVKQSIYGFRGSKSKFFVEKQKQFERDGDNNLAMTRNFRSADAVLDAVNEQFSLAMTLQTSNVDYSADSYMEKGGRYALNSGKVEIHYLPEEEKKTENTRGVYSVRAKTTQKEKEENRVAKLIASIIRQEKNGIIFDADIGEERQVEYSDIAILSRKKQGQISKTVAALAESGVPVTAASAVNVCDYAEIKTLIDILSLIDNAEQDVPLCSALLSAMGGMTVDDLAEIRLAYPTAKTFREACRLYATEQESLTAHKLRKFYEYYKKIRSRSHVLHAGELLTEILSETRMEAQFLGMEKGEASLRRIQRFMEETVAERPLCVHEFLNRLRDLEYNIEFNENGGENSVKVLTMHASKGLEYPIVILDNLSAHFRGADHDDVLVEETYGLAPRAYDTEKMLKNNTLLRRLNEEKELENSIQDELNLYYVALTRAKHTIHMVFEKRLEMPNARYAKSFAEFTDFDVWRKYETEDKLFDLEKQDREPMVFKPDEDLARQIMQAFLWEYPFKGFENFPVKSSATALLDGGQFTTNINAETTEETNVVTEMEAEMGMETEMAVEAEKEVAVDENAEKEAKLAREKRIAEGLAYHAFLERFDFSLLYDAAGAPVNENHLKELVEEQLSEMLKSQQADLALLSAEKLVEILKNAVFYQLSGATLYKEQQFLVNLPIAETYAKQMSEEEKARFMDSGEEMIFQGAIDLLAVFPDGVRIIDYKFSKMGAEYLREHYTPQLALYRLAVAKILKMDMQDIRCTIVNIDRGFQVELF